MISIGVDIVDLDRTKSIYEAYRSRLKRFLTPSELSYIRDGGDREWVAFAQLLSLKEAVFKALEIPWFGIEGWRKISFRYNPGRDMTVVFKGDLRRFNSRRYRIWLNVGSTQDFVLARAIIERARS